MEGSETDVRRDEQRGTVTLPDFVAPAIVSIAMLAGLLLRWADLQRWSLWWDEGFTLWASGLPIGRVIPFARSDNQAPLYYLLQHYWDALFGDSEFALRALSALLGTLALPVFYLLAKKVLKDGIAAALAFWLFAFSMKQIWYSREARAYEAASFFACLALYALVTFLEKRSAWAFATVVVSSTLTLYLHSMMFFYLLALNIVWMIYPSERSWTRCLREMTIANTCIGILYLPWVLSLLAQVTAVAGNLYWVPRPTLWNVAGTLRATAGFDSYHLGLFVKRFLPVSAGVLEDGIRAGIAALCGALLVGGFWRVAKPERRKNLCFIVYCLIPILSVFIVSRRLPLYIERVFTASSIAAPIVFAFPLAAQKGRRGKFLYAALGLALGGITAFSGFGFIRAEQEWAKSGEDWRGAITTVLTIPETDRLIIFAPPAGEIFFDYYSRNFAATSTRVARAGLQADFHGRFPPPKSRIITGNDIERLKMLVESHNYSEIDLVLTHQVDPYGITANYLGSRFVRQDELTPAGPITVIPFRALQPP